MVEAVTAARFRTSRAAPAPAATPTTSAAIPSVTIEVSAAPHVAKPQASTGPGAGAGAGAAEAAHGVTSAVTAAAAAAAAAAALASSVATQRVTNAPRSASFPLSGPRAKPPSSDVDPSPAGGTPSDVPPADIPEGLLPPSEPKRTREAVQRAYRGSLAMRVSHVDAAALRGRVEDPQHATTTTYVVDAKAKICGCGIWQVSGIPCSHAVALLRSKDLVKERGAPVLIAYVDPRLTLKGDRALFEIGGESMLQSLREAEKQAQQDSLQPPVVAEPLHRPRRKRRAPPVDARPARPRRRRVQQCGNCGQTGHNRKGCTNGYRPRVVASNGKSSRAGLPLSAPQEAAPGSSEVVQTS